MSQGAERVYSGDRIVRVVARKEAERLVNQGRAVQIYRGETYMGIRLLDQPQVANYRAAVTQAERDASRSVLQDADAVHSCQMLSKAEVEAIAFRTKSRTEGLSEAQRDSRVARGFPEMDLAERARAKFHQMFGVLAKA